MDPSHMLSAGYSHPLLRDWHSQATKYDPGNLVYPIFVLDVDGMKNEIPSMPGQYQWSVDRLTELLDPLVKLGLRSVILFGVVTKNENKSPRADFALSEENPVVRALKLLKSTYPSLYLICDVCMCQYTSHGHCGIINDSSNDPLLINNDSSVALLARIAKYYASSGANMIAPSDMIDGRIAAIKQSLVEDGLQRQVPVMSYSAKFASAMYGPFRDAAHSKPTNSDRKCYQLPIGSSDLALRALKRDIEEGADFVMVKPGGSYLDIIQMAKRETSVPVAVYQVSGEYSMLLAAAESKVFDLKAGVEESIVAFRRSGADIIITYFTPQLLEWMSASQ